MNTTRKGRFIQKATRLTVKVLLFSLLLSLFLYAGVGTDSALIPDDMLDASIEPGIAQADAYGSSVYAIDSFADYPDVTSFKIDEFYSDYYTKRGGVYSTSANHTTNSTWDSNTWTIGRGGSDWHTGTDYANVWFDFDFGSDWKKYSDSLQITVTGTASNHNAIGGYNLGLMSSDSAYGNLSEGYYDTLKEDSNVSFNGTVGGGGSEKTMDASHTGDSYKKFTGNLNISHTIKGRYVRIVFCTWSTTGNYGQAKISNVDITITRTPKNYTVNYNKNASDATGTVSATSHQFMIASNVSSSTFARPGYVQNGWNTASNGTGTQLSLGASTGTGATSGLGLAVKNALAASTTSVTLYATWRPVAATITYNANGGSGSGSTAITYGTDFTLHSGSGFTRSGYVFVGWSNSSGDNNSANYSPGQTITDDKVGSFDLLTSSNDGKSVTLYAVWKSGDFGIQAGGTGLWGSFTNPFVIENDTHLANLSEIVNGVRDPVNSVGGTYYGQSVPETQAKVDSEGRITYADCFFIVSADVSISYSDTGLRPIGSSTATPFKGNFNGNSKTITVNASLSGVDYVGLFGYMNAGSISNLTVAGTVTGRHYVGGVLGYLDWKTTATAISISNVQNKCTVSGTNYVGGVFGKIDYRNSADYGLITMTSVSNTGAVSGASYIGGIAGYLNGSFSGDGAKMYSCYNTGNITATGDYSGGLVGQCRNTQFNSCYTGSSKNSATVKGRNYVGGFVGQLIGGSTPAPASGVGNYNNMKVVSTGNQVGGYAGTTTWQSLAKFTNYGDISGVSNVGGVVGYYTINTTQTTSYLRNEGNVVATGNYVGGILGKAERPTNEGGSLVIGGTVYSTGSVKGARAVGGAFGYLDANTDVTNATITVVLIGNSSFAEGDDGINASGYAGGVFGVIVSNATTVTGTISVSGDNVDNAGFLMGGLVGYNAGSITASTTVSLRVIGRGSSAVPESEAFIDGLTLTTGAGYVGGIAGYNAGTISNAIKVTGDVLSVSQTAYTGGVAGYNAGTISNCSTTSAEVLYNATIYGGQYVGGIAGYNAGSVSYCYNVFGTIYGTSNVGAVSGNGGTITVSYTFYRSSSEPSWGGNYAAGVPDSATVTPLTAGAEADSWIVADGFKIVHTLADNTYLSVVERGTTTAYYPTSFATYTVSGTTKTLVYDFSKSTSGIKSFTVTQVSPAMTLSYVFDGASHQARINSIPTGYTQSTAGSATYVTDGTVASTITVKYGDLVMGTISTTVTITKKSATFTAKALTLYENQRPGYDVDVLDTAYCTISGIIGGHSVTTCVVTDDYTPTTNINSQTNYTITISINDIVIKDSNGVDRTANYAITTTTATLTVKLADYGRMAHGATLPWGGTVDENATWGSASNPYYIALDRHFNNLRSIVNGGSYINSIGGDAQATDRTYLGAYFVLGYDVNTGGTLTDDSFGNVTYTVATNADWGNDGEKLTNIADGNVSTKFCDHNAAGFEFQYNMSSEEYVDSFTFTNASDAANFPKRIPEYFSIQGSRDGSTWTTICTVRDSNHNWSASSGKYTIQLDKPGYYRYFKVYVRSRRGFEINGNVNTDYVEESNADPLQFADLSFSGATIKVGGTHTPIGKDTSHAFNGHFNGNGHTVTLTVSVLGNYAGLFGYMRAGSITNLTVDGEIFATGNYVGALVGHTHSQDRSADPVIEDVTTNATVTGQGNFVGGIIGCAQDTNLRGDLKNTGNVVGVNYVGGITGSHFGSNSSNATILNSGAVSGNNNVGGYAGEFNWGTVGGTITNSGRIVASNNYAGGIIGYNHDQGVWGNGTFTNNGVVIGIDYVGGIAGAINIPANTGQNSYGSGLVFLHTAQVHGHNYVGGIVGYWTILDKSISAKFNTNGNNCPGSKEVVSGYGEYIGGFFGWVEGITTGDATGTINFAVGSVMSGEIDCAEGDNVQSGQHTGSGIGGIAGVNNGAHLNFSALTSAVTGATINGNRENNVSTVTLNETNYTGAFMGGIVGYNSGNITGPSNGAKLRDGGVLYAVSKGNYLGGVVGFNYAGEIKDCKVATGFSASYAGSYVGGIAGYVYGGTISGSTSFSGTVYGVNYVGSLVGKYDSTTALSLSNLTNTNTITATGNYVGGFFGWINTTAAVNLTNLTNNATITGVDHVGGIAGQTTGSGTLSGLVNSKVISGGNYVGGLFGELGTGFTGTLTASTNNATVSGKANYVGGVVGIHHKGTIQNCVNKGAVNGVSNVGGITGRSATNISNTAITVKYCMNNGTITASNGYAGGVIGYYSPGSASLSATYLYNFGSVSGSTYGGIIGINTTSYISVTNSWSFYTSVPASADLVGRYTYTGKYVVNEVGATILPSVGMDLHTDWTAITSNNFNGFYFASGVTAEAGKYLSLEILDKASSPKVTGYAQPNTAALRSTHDANAGTCVFENFGYGSSFDGNIRARFLDVAGGFHDLVYDGTDKAASGNQTEAFIDEVRVSGYTSSYRFSLVNKSEDTVNVGTFTYDAHIMAGNEIVGCKKNGSATISQFDINSDDATGENGAALIFFDGVVYGGYDTYYDSNLGKTLTNVTTFKNADTKGVIDYNPSATETFYIYRLKSDGTMILVYSVRLSYGAIGMDGTHHPTNSAIALNGSIITTHNSVTTTEDGYLVNRMEEDGSTSFVPSGNYKSTDTYVTLNYFVIDSDYGIIAASDRNGDDEVESEWGSVDNPYVISHWIHLLRLSEIVNQISAPINSVQGIGAGNSANARSKDVFYTAYLDGTIKKSYFLVTANITMPDYINFKPIGGWSAIANQDGATTFYSYENNASNYFGGVFDGNFASGAYATIRLGNQFSALNGDYVGLFGVMKGVVLNGTVAHAEVKNVDVLTADASNAYYNVAGAQYVGVIVGKAQEYVLIDRAYANTGLNNSNKDSITVSGTNFVGSVVGYLGLGSEMYGEYVNYAKVSGSSYVGGIIGQIMAGAGRQGTGANAGTYYLGEYTVDEVKRVSSMTNYGSVVGSQAYTGGVIGAMTQNVAPYDGVITVFEPTFIRNEANVTGQTVVGGLVGRIELNNAIRLINTEDEGQANWSYNGNIDSTVYEITTNTSYAGGLFGVLSTMGHQIESVFSTAVVKTSVGSSSNEGNYIGGLVGYMNGGTFRYSFVSLPGNQNVDTTTNMVRGNKYVGGLVGNMSLGTLDTCYVQGFKYDNNLTTARGGVAGVAATVATIKDTWALYLTADPTYQSVPANAYGNYILSFYSTNDGAMNAYIDEMFVFAGLIPDSAVSRAHATGSANEIEAKKGSISLGITLPSVGTITGYDQKAQVVFYDGSGYEDPFEHAFEAAANDSNEHNLFLRLSASTEGSVIIAKTSVRFGSISNYTNSTAWEEKYLYIGKTGLYKVDVVDHPTDDGNYHRGSYQTSYSFDYSATGNYVKTSRDLTFQYAKYSAVAPRVIDSLDDWKAFALDVQKSGANGLNQYVKLATNLTGSNRVPTKYTSGGNVYSGLAGLEHTPYWNGDIQNVNGGFFSGTFDGDGYEIEIYIVGGTNGQTFNTSTAVWSDATAGNTASSVNELSLFPQARGTNADGTTAVTFMNLTISGTITNAGYDCAAFVGHARGSANFYNCTSNVDITSNQHSCAGIVGTTKGNRNANINEKFRYEFIGCVNLGDIRTSGEYEDKGTGGILGHVWNGDRNASNDTYSNTFATTPYVLLDSCRNNGTVWGSYNVGGIVGKSAGSTEIMNCGNTNNVTAYCKGYNEAGVNKDGHAGGIIGLVGTPGHADVYTSYNTGTVHAWGNKAGGIMGADTEYTSQNNTTKVYYCYNTGTVITGLDKPVQFGWEAWDGAGSWSDEGSYYTINVASGSAFGVNVGGILGTAVKSDVRYCYNAGDVIVRGAAGEAFTWHSRAGGIIGLVDGTETYVRNSYNVGDVKVQARGDANDRPKYNAGIVGYFKAVEGTESRVFDCYSLKWQIQWQNNDGNTKRYHIGGFNHSGESIGEAQYDTDTYASSGGAGHVLSSVAELTAMMKSNEEISTNSVNSLNGSSESDARVLINNDIKSGNYPGWIFLPGCLPQLSMFAVDTQDGLAMTSLGYGRNNLGEYVQQVAGSEFNPYVIKDGIDLLGVMALTSAKGGNSTFGFDGKFIEFANGTNNLAGDVCSYIQLPTADVNSGNDYVFYDGSTKKKGKSYHLYDRGANGLHNGTLSTSDATISASNKTAPATSVYATNQESSGNFTLNSSNAYSTWKARNYGYNGSWVANLGYKTSNWYPIGYLGDKSSIDRSFRGHITGDLGNGTNAEIRDINSYYGFNRTNVYAGLFGVVRNAHVENITVTGTIQADTLNDNGIISAGIVAKALDNSYISGLQAGIAGTEPRPLTVKTGPNGGAGYTGGIVGMADSGATGNRLTIADSVVVNASIKGFKNSIGGIIGYSVGADASSFTDIIGCHVVGAHIESTASEKKLLGGIVGAQGATGALTVSGCHVGTEGNTPADLDSESSYSVVIKGDHSFGGIISFAEAGAGCANAFIDCYVWEDVLIKRYNDNNETDKGYGTAIGGIVGYVSDDASGYATFRGEIEFHGTINVSDFANVQNVGGVVGYMGSSARMEQCFVTVAGTIDAERCSNADSIGGFAGISKGVALDGIFTIAPSLLTDTADNVGGFIGLNDGDTYITRTTTIETGGQIKAHYNVGGFIGANAEGSALHMGAAEYKGTVYGEDGDSATITLGASVDGRKYVGGFLGYNKGDVFGEYCTVTNNGKVGANDYSKGNENESIDCIGGVFGDNSTGGTISISENATFINNGQVGHSDYKEAYQEFVGGVLGVALGDITNNGVMRNTGDVFGYEYVGGAIGGLVNGTISGQLANGEDVMPLANADSEALVASDEALSTADTGSSSVSAVVNVGGVIGIVMQNAIIDGAIMYNYGHVESSGDEYEVSNLGGAIGLNYGVIQNGAQFYNYGTIKAKNFAGGALGVSDGVIRDSNFYNYATITFTGDTALGGSVGYITNNYTSHGTTAAYYPANNAALGTYDSTRNRSQVTGSYFGYESNGDNKVVLQATGEHPYPLSTILSEVAGNEMVAFVAKGGLGGVFGAINSDYMTEEGGWSGNTFFIYGDVYGGVFLDGNTNNFTPENFGGTVDAVGGVIGAIEVSHISISNMLIYKSNVGGKDYVGGIVGYNDNANEITGAGAAIDNCYNVYGEVIGTTYNDGAISASYKHVGGIVGFVPSSTDPGLINDSSDYNKPVTNASYWIKSYSNEHLQNSNPQDIVNTLDKASTWTEFLSHADYINNNDPYYQVDDEGNVINEGILAEGQTWDEYFAIHTQYVQNANEDWGTYQDVTINYNTGVKATGFYYIFAEAEEGNAQFEYAKEAIQVEHSNKTAPLTSPYTNDESLNFWLIIANSAGQSVKSYKSDQVAPYVNGGNVVPGYIYSTAFNSNKNGYYLYVSDESTGRAATSLYAGSTDANGNTQVYVSSDASTAGNVMIFYKEAVMLSYLNYNGYERYAPIADVTYKQDMTGGVYGTNYYSFTNDVAGDTINTGREAGSYDVQASIYTVDKVGTVITLGKLDSTLADGEDYKWNIRKRTLEVEFETGDIGDTGEDKNLWNRYDGTFSHYIKFTVTNFAKDEHISEAQVYEAINNMMALKYSFNGSSSTETIEAIYDSWNFLTGSAIPDSTGFDESVTHIAYYRTDYDGSSAKPGDKSNTIVDGTYSELGSLQIYKADYIVFVKKAGKHTVKVEVAGTEKNHSSPKKNSKDYNVDMRDLILDFTYSQGSSLLPTYEFDGGVKWQGIQSVVISGFLVGDALKDNITTVGSTASLLNGDGKADKDNIVANDNNTVTVNFFANNAGTYNAHIEISEAIRNNYRFVKQSDAGFPGSLSPSTNSYEWDASWTINKYVITLENLKITSDQVLIYNGREQSPTFSGEGGSNFVKEHGNETITIICDASVTNGSGVTKAVNVDTYKINVAASGSGGGSGTVEGENSLATNGINNYQINYTLDSEQEQDVTFEIVPREVRLVWDNPDLSYVYSGNAQGLSINDLTFEMKDDEGTWAEYKDAKISVENGKIKVSNVFAYDGKSETLYFSFSDFTAEDAGSYTAKVTEFDSVSGTNDAGSAEKGNYSASLPGNKTYNIAKSKIVVAYNNNTNLDKTFDNTSTVKANLGSVSLSSQNGGATSVRVTLSNAFFCDNSGNAVVDVGNGYSIKVNMSLSDTKNYEFVGASTQKFDVGAKITPAPLTITLNNSSSGANTVYKTFDNSDIYAVVESNGTNRVSSTGTQFRTGRGITVDGFFTDGVTVTATFAEIDGNRAWASKYVNNVIRTVSTPYVYTMSNEDFYKKLHIVLSSEGGESNNYYIAAVKNKSGTTILTQSSGQYIDVMDSRAEGSNTNGDNIKIAITKYSLKATYSNTAQSYANPDNSYNLDWLEVDGTLRIPSSWGLSSSDLDVDVANGWMYVNGTSGEKKQYEQYTRIAGSASSTRLGAVLSSDDGYDLCVTLRNQPTLVIGYFVSKDGEEIGTMAGLLIATEYFKNNFNAEGAKGYDFTQTLVPLSALNSNNVPADVFAKINSGDINTWEELIEAVPDFNVAGYTFNEVTYNPINLYYDMSTDIEILEEKLNKTEQEQAYLDALISQRDSFELTYVALTEGGEETLQYVYWKAEEISENLSFKSFVLVDNIDAILTEEDMAMLKGAFGTNWGVGKTYLTNVLFAEVGSVVIFNGPVFDYTTDGEGNTVAFDGVFDGAGYSIDHLTIAYNVDDSKSTHNVGMFAEVSGTGSQVTAINLRNLSIQVVDTTASAKVINVGGVAGKFAASTVMEDVTVHGTISVKSTLGTVHAGGVIGSDSTGYVDGGVSKVIDGAIVVATVRAEGAIAVAGGVIGIMNEVNTTLTDVVSLSEVYAKGANTYANGFVGQYAKLVGGNASYDQDGIDYAPLNSDGKTSAYMNSVFEISADGTYTRIAGGVSYDTLYDGSNSIYIENGEYVVYPTSDQKDSKPELNTYDVINEYLAGSETNARESMRLRDIVDTYVLGYELTKTTVGEIITYAKSTTSKYVGTADGTADNRIGIAYQQHLNLIRMFNYMNFTLNRNVTMYTGYKLYMVDEAFTGTMTAGSYVINVRDASVKALDNGSNYPVFFANQTAPYTWLKID